MSSNGVLAWIILLRSSAQHILKTIWIVRGTQKTQSRVDMGEERGIHLRKCCNYSKTHIDRQFEFR